MDNYRVAVASSDGIVVNDHFGKAKGFYIYQVSEDERIIFLEKREMTPVCDQGNHDKRRLRENLEKLEDCRYLLVSRIGNGAAAMAESMGIESYEIPGMIQESIEKLIKYIKIQRLFE
ncbi:MAG: dinitrogenase iron-molybdenum cofactor biosynthesis protein [Eubacterium sp.]|nr:dinitrogenase iron-molybdenum cofactor biosynthesis protein [Eubacterium sp.]